MKKVLMLCLALFIPLLSFAQIEFGPRYEQTHSNLTIGYTVIPNGPQGLLILQKNYAPGFDNPVVIKHLDADLRPQWETTINIEHPFFIKGYHYVEEKTYLLLWNQTFRTIRLLSIDTKKQEIEQFETQDIIDLEVTKFEVIKNTALVGGTYLDRPSVLAFNFKKGTLRTLENVYKNQASLLDIKINKDSLTFNVLISTQNRNRDWTVATNTYDFEGNPIRNYELETKPDYWLLDGVVSSINDITQVVVGQYSIRSESSVAGIYVNYIDRTGKQTMTYHNLGTLPTYLDYMGSKRADKLKRKAIEKMKEGKEPQYRTKLRLRAMIEQDDRLIINGSSFRQTEFTHKYTLALNQEGKILWDSYLSKDEVNLTWPIAQGRFQSIDKDHGTYLFYFQKYLFLKYMDGEGQHQLIKTPILLKKPSDEIIYEKAGSISTENWFDNKYLIYGVQHIRPKDKSEKLRMVFFISSIAVKE